MTIDELIARFILDRIGIITVYLLIIMRGVAD